MKHRATSLRQHGYLFNPPVPPPPPGDGPPPLAALVSPLNYSFHYQHLFLFLFRSSSSLQESIRNPVQFIDIRLHTLYDTVSTTNFADTVGRPKAKNALSFREATPLTP